MQASRQQGWLKKVYRTPSFFRHPNLKELVKAYEDLEKVLRRLKKQKDSQGVNPSINVIKLVDQLSASKKRLERKITNTILLEKQQIKKHLRQIRNRSA